MSESMVAIKAFLPFYSHVVPRSAVEKELREPLLRAAVPDRRDSVLDQAHEALLKTVETQSYRILIGEFHAFREQLGLPMESGGDTALRRFTARLEEPGAPDALLEKYPVLRLRLTAMLSHSLDAYREFLTAFADDHPLLAEAGLLGEPGDDGRLLSAISPSGSDLHNDSRQVHILHLANGTRLVFKPRPLTADDFVRDLYRAVAPYLEHPLSRCVPRSFTVGTHGWQEFTVPAAMEQADQPGRYFYRIGALAVLFGSIGATDLHDENLLACGEHPCVIDTETMLRPDAGVGDESLPDALMNHTKLSVASTMLVPMVNPTSPVDFIMAGVGVAGDQPSSMTSAVIRDPATDAIAVSREPFNYRQGDNVPRLGETHLIATEWFDAILAGCRAALTALRDGAVTRVLEAHPGVPVRLLLRSTMIYGRFIDASTHPKYLVEPKEAERLFGLLKMHQDYLSPEAQRFAEDAERASLHLGNVPYFVTRGDSDALGTVNGSTPGVYSATALDFARRGVAHNAARTDAYHHFLLEECFGELCGEDTPGGLSASGVFGGHLLAGARPGAWWRAIAGRIAEVRVPVTAPGGQEECGWVGGIGPDRDASTITPGNFVSFHDTAGVVSFLNRAAARDESLAGPAGSADRGLTTLLAEYGEALLQRPESVFTGAASLLLVRPEDPETASARLAGLLQALQDRAAEGVLETDLSNGPAGLLMVLLDRLRRDGSSFPADATTVERLTDLTLSHLGRERDTHWSDLAHGELGLRWAAARTGSVLGLERTAKEAADWLIGRWERDGVPAEHGWCKGAAGLLLAGSEILAAAGREDWLTESRLADLVGRATALAPGRAVDLSVCHGSSGVVQCLIGAGRTLGRADLFERAAAHQTEVLGRIREDGYFTGAAGRTSLIGYMLGWAGVGDTDLMVDALLSGADPAGLRLPLELSAPSRT
ncbi:type 2 lanthipeptide synthetase LanM [Streptomyces sp. NPDC006482]|uniref:type 2 lanthipeptide synthetase LanM n=1 Tax=Streptomyces sp. NPDC006482 TaxID=3154306 RepID=UPI0033B62BE5